LRIGLGKENVTVNTRIVCVVVFVLGFFLNLIFFHYAFRPDARFAKPVTEGFVSYMAAVPIILFFLKGERVWRWSVFGIWCLYVAVFGYVMLTMD
jgi:hypothetical protein